MSGARPGPAVVASVLAEVAAFGEDNDARVTERSQRMLNITPDTGQLLRILIQATRARRILEVGTSNGYSTLWLAWSVAETDGHVDSIDHSADKIGLARANLERAGLAEWVTLHHGPAATVLTQLAGPYELIFLDADRPSYLSYLELLLPRLADGGLLVTDNVVSHAAEVETFLARLRSNPQLETVTLPIGKGEELTLKRPPGAGSR
jgi:predicted O-methyltransferase YrrM